MKILVVEDDKNSLKLMVHFLKRFGSCDTAHDGLEAIAAVMEAYRTEQPYDLLVLDIMMPNMDGIETLQSVRKYEAKRGIPKERVLKTIIVSALTGDTVRIEAYEKGCMAYIRKPVDFHLLEKILRDELAVPE